MTAASRKMRVLKTLGLALAAGSLVIAPALAVAQPAHAAPERTAWTASGPSGSYTLDSDGTSSTAQFSYNLEPAGNTVTRTWSMMTTATQDGSVTVEYEWVGSHAWCDAVTLLNQVVESGSARTSTPIIDEGPNCSGMPPNGNFSYSDTVTFDVAAGDTYGFELGGSNRDLNNFLRGTLRIGIPELPDSQTITFPDIADTALDAGPIALNATASSGQPVSYASTTSDTCSVENGIVTLIAAGTCSIDATQEGIAFELDPAPAQMRSFAVLKIVTQIDADVTDEGAVGENFVGVATVTPAPTGERDVQFAAYADDQCETDPVFTSAGALSADGIAQSAEFVPESAGTYYWVATYEGDESTLPAATACGDLQSVVTAAETPTSPPGDDAPADPVSDATGELPRTGADGVGGIAALGGVLLASGLALLMTQRIVRRAASRR